MNFCEKLIVLIDLFEKWLSEPEDSVQIEQWIDSANTLAYSFNGINWFGLGTSIFSNYAFIFNSTHYLTVNLPIV